jgi:D-alanyl-D-alanine carboxypeptidase
VGLVAALLVVAVTATPAARKYSGNHELAPGLHERMVAALDSWQNPAWRLGVAVVGCRSESLLFGAGAAAPLVPASNMKLLTTAVAIEHWDAALVRELDSLLDRAPLRSRLHRPNRALAESLGLNAHPEFAGYRHLVLANRESVNDEAEWMLHHLLRRHRTNAYSLLWSHLDARRVPRAGLRVWDACGLSRRNRVSSLTLASLLSRIHNSPNGELFRSTLAVPGRPGTLIKRPLDAGDRVAAKTGYIGGVFSLSGYLAAERDTYAFAFIVNECATGTPAYQAFNSLLNAVLDWDSPAGGPN